MTELVSEPITPRAGTCNVTPMGRGEPGLPAGFEWRSESFDVVEQLGAWKESSREGGRAGGELYLRRHYYKLRMSNAAVWTVYFLRQPSSTSRAKDRWFLYTIEEDT